jgi:hypothetical protein
MRLGNACKSLAVRHVPYCTGYEETTAPKKGCDGIVSNGVLIFDPSSDGRAILSHLSSDNTRWKQMVKRGMHTLVKDAYEIMYIREGLMTSEEKERSKNLAESCTDYDPFQP